MKNYLWIVRHWMQNNALNGDIVHWGSDEFLKLKPLTVKDMEQLALAIHENTLAETKVK